MSENNNIKKGFWNSIIKSIVALTLSVTLGVTTIVSCANSFFNIIERRKNSTSTSTTEVPISSTELENETIIQDNVLTLEKTQSLLEIPEPTIKTNIPFTFKYNNYNEIDIEKYITAIDKIDVNYKNKKYYPTKNDTFKMFADAYTTVTRCDYQFNGDINNIINKLIENSKEYVIENPNYVIPFKDKNSQNQTLLMQQTNFEETLYKILNTWKNNTNDINEDFCSLENYNIVFSFDEEEKSTLLAYTTHNTLVIFPKRIQEQSNKFNENFEELLYSVMNHQLNIIRQRACKCRIYRTQSYFRIPTRTLTDASTESETKYYDNPSMYSLHYQDEKQSEDLLLTLALFRDGLTYKDYYNAIYNSDLISFHTFFNATTEEEVNKLYTILYAIDAVNLKNDLLLTHYNINDYISTNEIRAFVGHSYKIDIFKIVLKNMIQYTNEHNDYTIEDNLIMFNLVKALIGKESYEILISETENNTKTITYEDDFIENIYALENIYFEFLSNKYNISIQEIKEIENDNITGTLCYIEDYCRGNYSYIPERYYYIIENLVNRFPILKSMFNAPKYLISEYDNLVHNATK